ncbi:MAG: hypothetical protein J5875_06835 [Paludibacteraceae bacterium]|nr:hypothetical protein [Paludibacteraceae bacterium]MBQ4036170.1 hypothetical protein [Paludibacteraceae bacterium]MBR6041436.1 hypothetical protein [Paludibacteraceae bacterium]
MKLKLLFLFLGFYTFFSANAEKKIEVIYLTANAYCPSVEQIENEAKTVIDSLYKTEKANGTIIERKLNIMEEANQDFIHKWEISTNGLILLVHDDNTTKKVDLNDFAFSNVPSDIPFFKNGFAEKIKEALNK